MKQEEKFEKRRKTINAEKQKKKTIKQHKTFSVIYCV